MLVKKPINLFAITCLSVTVSPSILKDSGNCIRRLVLLIISLIVDQVFFMLFLYFLYYMIKCFLCKVNAFLKYIVVVA